MQESEQEQFDDPALKEALRRVWTNERAPRDLAERVLQAMEPAPMRIGRVVVRVSLAAAAMVLLGLLIVGYREHQNSLVSPPGAPGATGPAVAQSRAMPDALAEDLVSRHDICCAGPDHHMPGLPRNNFAMLTTALSVRLGHDVLAKPLGGNWSFKGGSICPCGSINSAHLVFKDGSKNVSVFSLPMSVIASATPNEEFAQIKSGHALFGYTSANAFFCVVCNSPDGSMTLDIAREICHQLRTEPMPAASTDAPAASGPAQKQHVLLARF